MGKRLETTPRSKVRAALRQLFLRSRERAQAIRRDKYTCQVCGRKQSKAKGKEFKVQVHHIHGICNWEAIIDLVYEQILCHWDKMQTLCPECHLNESNSQGKQNTTAGIF
jgi:5-methylcytosine-specific restriction endonuclease McrA